MDVNQVNVDKVQFTDKLENKKNLSIDKEKGKLGVNEVRKEVKFREANEEKIIKQEVPRKK